MGLFLLRFITSNAQLEKTFFWKVAISYSQQRNLGATILRTVYIGGLRIWHLDQQNNDRDGS